MLNNFFTDTENLFKLLFVNGILIILIGLFYPLQKRDELELKIIEYNSDVKLLNRDIKEIYDESNKLKKEIKIAKSSKTYQNTQHQTASIKLKQKIYQLDKKVIEVENQKIKISKLESQQETYNKYCKAFLVFGGLITSIGLLGWSRLTYFMYNKEYSDYKTRNSQLPNTNRLSLKKQIIIGIILTLAFIASLYFILK